MTDAKLEEELGNLERRVWSKEQYLGGIASGRIEYRRFEAMSNIDVMVDGALAVLALPAGPPPPLPGAGNGPPPGAGPFVFTDETMTEEGEARAGRKRPPSPTPGPGKLLPSEAR